MSVVALLAVMACSSCGTGGDDPLILNPGERTRMYLGSGATHFSGNIVSDGSERSVTGVGERRKNVFSVGQRVTRDSFITAALPQVTNVSAESGESRSGLGDPAFGLRYNVVNQNFTTPLVPQVQVLGGFKPKSATSTYTAADQRAFLDAFGTGHSNVRVGVDVWSAMSALNYGFSYSFVHALPEVYNGEEVAPGNVHSTNVTVGSGYGSVKAVTGIVRNDKEEIRIDGGAVSGSRSLQHNLFVTAIYRPAFAHEVRVTFVDEGKLFRNVNTTSGRTWTGAYILSL